MVAFGSSSPGNHNDCKAFGEPGAEYACRNATVIGAGEAQRLTPAGEGPRRARVRSNEDLEDPAGL